jgi:hypothetical protein
MRNEADSGEKKGISVLTERHTTARWLSLASKVSSREENKYSINRREKDHARTKLEGG